ncbi:MAG: precorrin-3B C(17)-methyltransferase [Deltaproteobacteria bacterium GWC2_55_46]|nr:MAG: precorrin-3B C(17)-methyltransferase [Deltaproteobacteria bacterium GWA2_55_82]OGQ64209.1 MAG: precorrin-3B C(17)-methyltransferase [Deltaproteobacteria bacterium RIFCSPLOWO2_02_FULL_55_12]OIJ75145.1 MAG: precorrin-3B C(17)-methyltransferase [Deltaproteobacteria bacterium GWC2_55_46]
MGPGGLEHLTIRAKEVLQEAECIVGYTRYVDLVRPIIQGKEVFSTGMTHEVERCARAVEVARGGKTVAVVSSGDAGIYGMAGLVFELMAASGSDDVKVEVIPGVPAFVSAASLLGAPLMHDFASISLSDLLTDWPVIQERVEAAAKADFVILLYNPKSSKRVEGLGKALSIIGRYRKGATPVGIVRNASREDEEALITTLDNVPSLADRIDMLTILVIGNSSTFIAMGRMVTPRGYRLEGAKG